MKKEKIVLDVDGVLLDFGASYLRLAQEIFDGKIIPDYNQYFLKDYLRLEEQDNEKVWKIFNQRNCWKNIEPLANVDKAIANLKSANVEIILVTSIDPVHKISRLENLSQIGLIPHDIHCVGDGNAHKHEHISRIQPIAFIDDRLDHLLRSKDVPHLAWVDHGHNQSVELFPEISATVKSLYQWTEEYLPRLFASKGFKP